VTEQKENQPQSETRFLRVRMPQHIGLFATLSHCVFLCKYCFEQNIRPIFAIENELYGKDWFDRLFRHRVWPAPDDEVESVLINNRLDINVLARGAKENEISDELTSIEEGARLFHHFLAIRDEIMQRMETEAARLVNERTIGVHFRGTDKLTGLECSPVSCDEVLAAAKDAAGADRFIYLATDDLPFFELMRKRIPSTQLRYSRKPGGQAHYDEPGTFQKGLEAMTDTWLLSKCSLLIKTPSIMSAWSVIFNPTLPFILIGEPKGQPSEFDLNLRNGVGFFPENLLHQAQEKKAASYPPTA
jgi:hypothetical protein